MLRTSDRVVSLLGCGWLAYPLAKALISQGFTVRASTTTPSKLEVLKADGIDPYLVHFADHVAIPDLKNFFKAEILIITIPPGRRDPSGFDNYRRMIDMVCSQIPHTKVSKLILISSTSVYGNSNDIINEFSSIAPETDSGKLMADTECQLRALNVNFISLRLAGLIGPGRMPWNFFAGKSNIPNGNAPVNLIHLKDVIGIIQSLIKQKDSSGIYNGCAPSHPSREEFYTLAAKENGSKRPDFIKETGEWKIISSCRVEEELKYTFEFPSLTEWLSSGEGR